MEGGMLERWERGWDRGRMDEKAGKKFDNG